MNQKALKIIGLFCWLGVSSITMAQTVTDGSRQVVKDFLEDVRSGRNPQNARLYLADTVSVHNTVTYMPENYIITPERTEAGIRDRQKSFGDFKLEIVEMIGEGEKVYVRWKEIGKHVGDINGYNPTGEPIITLASCVYLVKSKKIVEYWMQVDYWGLDMQLQESKDKKSY